jgi:tRNA pseudouridine38-40 synthase
MKETTNIALILSYDGTRYHGWQVQKNGSSIQETLTDALERLLGARPAVSGVGRTDAGVHARRYVANFKAVCTVPMERLPLALNAWLPEDIAVSGATRVPQDFDARFQCTKKEYAYYIYPSRLRDPFLAARSYRCAYPLDIERMQEAAQRFVGTHDFNAVRSVGTPVKSTVRTIFHCEVAPCEEERLIRIRVCGDGFLYNMVRAIAGTLLYAGSGKLTPADITAILDSRDREQAGPTLPPGGLFLNRLWYENTPELTPFGLDL